jgi:hypothetical protein
MDPFKVLSRRVTQLDFGFEKLYSLAAIGSDLVGSRTNTGVQERHCSGAGKEG